MRRPPACPKASRVGGGSKKRTDAHLRARRRSSSIVIEKTLGGKMVEDFSKKSSRLTVVGNAPNPPRKLGEAGESLWFRVQSEYRIEDVGGVELLMQACLEQDRVEELAATISQDGARIITKSGPKDHPCLKH